MAFREVRTRKDSVLLKKALPVKRFGAWLIRLLDDMEETMSLADGVGLAAPQVGISKRVIVIMEEERNLRLINPEIISLEGESVDIEGCLSVPEFLGKVKRAEKVVVKALNEYGKEITIEAEGRLARALQHEIDHLDGVLFIDKAIEIYSNNPLPNIEAVELIEGNLE